MLRVNNFHVGLVYIEISKMMSWSTLDSFGDYTGSYRNSHEHSETFRLKGHHYFNPFNPQYYPKELVLMCNLVFRS